MQLRCLELEVQRLPSLSREPYTTKLKSYRQKISQHKEFFHCKLQSKIRNLDIAEDDEALALREIVEKRNKQLESDMRVMDENNKITNDLVEQLEGQGRKLQMGR